VARDEYAILRHDEIGLDVIGALLDRNEVRGERVLRNVAAGPAVTDHERRALARLPRFIAVCIHALYLKP
jgi:hypothetical protein